MLTQLARLSIETEGRYANDQELQFLQDYLDSAETRINAYEKVRDQAGSIIEKVEETKRDKHPHLFYQNGRSIEEICRRDMTNVLRLTATSMLIGDIDRLREGFLIWYKTLVNAFEYTPYAKINYRLVEESVKAHLTSEEMALMMPGLQLDMTVLAS